MSHQSELISTDIDAYLAEHEKKELLRLLTCGSVDDGKSTLIGRLLHDSKMVYEDQLAAVTKDSVKSGTTGDMPDLALLVDGLQAEREQGITIDVAYRYFSTSQRKFIIADTPGHEQYTRNMATGASNCDLAIILIDARYGVLTQTKRHSFIASLLGIQHVLVAVNKMDLVDFSESRYQEIIGDYKAFAEQLNIKDTQFIPISALNGDNVVNASEQTPWYQGPTLMAFLESVEISSDRNLQDLRFPVQYVNRPNLDFRGFCGTIASGIVKKGDEIMALPSGKTSRIASIVTYDGELEQAAAPLAITVTLEDEIDVSRGDMLVHPNNLPNISDEIDAQIVWMSESPMTPGQLYDIKLATKVIPATLSEIHYQVDINTLDKKDKTTSLDLNEIGLCQLSLNSQVAFDAYGKVKGTGAMVIIDRLTNITVGAGMITGPAEAGKNRSAVTEDERKARYQQQAVTINLTGTGATNFAQQLENQLFRRGNVAVVIDAKTSGLNNQALQQAIENINRSGILSLVSNGDLSAALTIDTETLSVDDAIAQLTEAGLLL